MQDLMIRIIDQYGYISILLMIAIENLFPPIPSEVILTFGGFMSIYGHLNILGVIASATIGSVIGAMIIYQIGGLLNTDRLTKWLDGWPGRIMHLKKSDITRANNWFLRYGNKAVFLCRCIPLVRSLISLPAGMTRMPVIPFLLLTTAGSLIWNTALVWFGAAAGESWKTITTYMGIYSAITIVLLGLLVLIAGLIFIKKRFLSR